LNRQFSGLEALLEGLEVVTPDGRHRYVFGHAPPLVRYTTDEQLFLHSGHNVLSALPCRKPDPCILLSQVPNKDDPAGEILVSEIRSSDLWDSENFPQPMWFCVLDSSALPWFCSGPAPQRFPSVVLSNFSGQFEWQRDRRQYLASYWNLPLQSLFSVSRWTIVSSESKLDVLAPLMRFTTSFLLVFLLATWIVLLLSRIQIRRNLVPLAKLQLATRRISLGRFQTRVTITSGDEFEEFASSFNSMAEQN
jgi:HAMP domain-containing protein